MKNKAAWLLPLAALLLVAGCQQSTTGALTVASLPRLNGAYCASSPIAVNAVHWDLITVTRSGGAYTLTNTSPPPIALNGVVAQVPALWYLGTPGWGNVVGMAERTPFTIEATSDSQSLGEVIPIVGWSASSTTFVEPAKDPITDSLIQQFIAQGPIYYKWELTGATWQDGACSGGTWTPAEYIFARHLAPASEYASALNGPDPFIWPFSSPVS
jgi:hypothetical protein